MLTSLLFHFVFSVRIIKECDARCDAFCFPSSFGGALSGSYIVYVQVYIRMVSTGP